jgi:tRNA pseudouridine55 synthase
MKLDQILLVDKPAGMTSFGVVARVRRQLLKELELEGGKGKEQPERKSHFSPGASRETVGVPRKRQRIRVGHTGTLDPFATGLMIVLTGKETKNAGEYSKLDKVYEATIILGKTSTTGDPEGKISSSSSKLVPDKSQIEQALQSFVGEISQTPPIYSAIKVNGQRAYKLARQGKIPEVKSRRVEVFSIELIFYSYPELRIRAHVSSGTYIRTLAEDIGKKLGTGAYTTELRRIKVGKYDIKNAKTLAELGITD